ncbi:MAG: ferritin-like domain-containing protein [Thiohalomonadales bacterium]
MKNSVYGVVKAALDCDDVATKLTAVEDLLSRWQNAELHRRSQAAAERILVAGVPAYLNFVAPRRLVQRGLQSQEGRAALVHAIAHIEFNAINLALDAVYRFRDMPCQYYDDWLHVAAEEAQHFQLVATHLDELGYQYGDFPVHSGLWDMALHTADDVLVRMALVPRVLEARGLDVTPAMIKRFESSGDARFADVLRIILRDEIGHVEIGTRWFHYCCDERGLDSLSKFKQLFRQYTDARVKLPLHREARLQAGFSNDELDYLEGIKDV